MAHYIKKIRGLSIKLAIIYKYNLLIYNAYIPFSIIFPPKLRMASSQMVLGHSFAPASARPSGIPLYLSLTSIPDV